MYIALPELMMLDFSYKVVIMNMQECKNFFFQFECIFVLPLSFTSLMEYLSILVLCEVFRLCLFVHTLVCCLVIDM